MAVSLSIASATASLPIAWRLYLPEEWANDPERCREADIPQEVQFQTKPQIALRQIWKRWRTGWRGEWCWRTKCTDRVAVPGRSSGTEAGLLAGGAQQHDGVGGGRQPLPPKPWRGKGAKPTRMRRDQTHRPITVKELAAELPEKAWREVAWREGSKETLRSRFAALRVRPAYGDDRRGGLQPEQWLLIEWPSGAVEPAGYWLARLPVKISMKCLVGIRKHRWVIERDYEELKSELGLAHYEGRNWRGFHHHATLCIAAYGFLMAERSRFFPSAHIPDLGLRSTPLPADFRPRGAPSARPTA